VTPSLRLATFSHLNKNGDEIFVDSDLQTKLCKHGETGSTIRTWLHAEARARAAGEPPPERPSVCDCTSTHGLQLKVDTRPPPPPPCVYDALAAAGVETLAVDGESGPACRLLGGFVGPAARSAASTGVGCRCSVGDPPSVHTCFACGAVAAIARFDCQSGRVRVGAGLGLGGDECTL